MKILFMDVDGTLTDGKIYIGINGECMKAFSVKDGYAIKNELPKHNILPVIITARSSKIVENRAKDLGISELYQSCTNKAILMIQICKKYGIEFNDQKKLPNTIYFGDDIPDMESMKIAEIAGCPGDAVQEVKEISDYICKCKAGDGAAREFINWIILNRMGK